MPIKNSTPPTTPSTCRNCLHYKSEGRRGGVCQLFHGSVQSNWESCSLASFPFIYSWEKLDTAISDRRVTVSRSA
ncbi:hypothetical protein N39L_51290 [Limnospira platensis NIES-39]|jgi:hypothetical protein|uniref:Uncharacterized protein n=1 Tax=Limnospira platensis NIES-46 TaxID=1236695 RepID=A0A5M3TFT3_LIMPL|nr:hypothetical protein N39L_51290 [Arthrospira platensis NIES-39]GCE96439.1 hypothetical protein NIES46_45110 [Arthrospira platensis NIES-46]